MKRLPFTSSISPTSSLVDLGAPAGSATDGEEDTSRAGCTKGVTCPPFARQMQNEITLSTIHFATSTTFLQPIVAYVSKVQIAYMYRLPHDDTSSLLSALLGTASEFTFNDRTPSIGWFVPFWTEVMTKS
ncbi:hypothetical protein FRC02_008822 [Tulasnella sp. 418]|nr:hypothetical protein FRC02_008822 [Tulasnella sp. 418]